MSEAFIGIIKIPESVGFWNMKTIFCKSDVWKMHCEYWMSAVNGFTICRIFIGYLKLFSSSIKAKPSKKFP